MLPYALHHFGKSDSKSLFFSITLYSQGTVWSNEKRGMYIKTNSVGIERRSNRLNRGTKMAPQGRPLNRPISPDQQYSPSPRDHYFLKPPGQLTICVPKSIYVGAYTHFHVLLKFQ